MCVVASCAPPTGDLAHNPGMCPDWELNLQPFGPQDDAQPTKSHWPGPLYTINIEQNLACRRKPTTNHQHSFPSISFKEPQNALFYGTFQKEIYIRSEAVEHKPFQVLLDSI